MTHNPESLNCETFEDRIHQILDDRLTLTGDWMLMDHAAQCDPCAEKLLDYDSVEDSMKLLQPDIERILAEADSRRSQNTFADRPLALIASLAALFLICVTCFHALNSGSNPSANRLDRPPARAAKVLSAKKTTKSTTKMSGSSLAMGTMQPKNTHVKVTYRKTADTSPFSPNFDVNKQFQLPRIPNASHWNDVTKRLETLEPVLNYSAELPGLRTFQCSLSVTIELLRQTFAKPAIESAPDLGFFIDPSLLAAV